MFWARVRLLASVRAQECVINDNSLKHLCSNVFRCAGRIKVVFILVKMNYEAERAMNQKRLRMEGEPGHGVVQGNGLPLNYIGKCL